jgi:hypothetical protein
VVVPDVALVVHLDQDAAVAPVEPPVDRLVQGAEHGRLALQPLVLAEVEDAQDHGHPQLVGPVEDAAQPVHVIRPQLALCGDRRVVPGLAAPGVPLGAAALQVDGEGEQPVPPPLGHGGEELAGVPLGVPAAVSG